MNKNKAKRDFSVENQKPISEFIPTSSIGIGASRANYFDHFTVSDLIDDLPPLDTINADQPIRKALQKMSAKKYSQLPVIRGKNCIGAVTLESILTLITREKCKGNHGLNFMDWPVSRFIDEKAKFVKPEDDLLRHVELIAEEGYVIVGSYSRLESLITNFDLVHFFKEKTETYLMLREIETCLRFIISESISKERLTKILQKIKRKNARQPSCIDDLGFDELRQVICGNWHLLESCFLEKEKVDKQLQNIRDLRNLVFHFRGSVTEKQLASIKRIRKNYLRLAYSKTRNARLSAQITWGK